MLQIHQLYINKKEKPILSTINILIFKQTIRLQFNFAISITKLLNYKQWKVIYMKCLTTLYKNMWHSFKYYMILISTAIIENHIPTK